MIPSRTWVALAVLAPAVLALASCRDQPAPQSPQLSEVLPNIPVPPDAQFVARSGGADAVQLTLMTPYKVSEIENYYRGILSKGRWKLVRDSRDPSGGLVLLAQQKGPPLWVRIRSTDDSMATVVDLIGAVVPPDTTSKADTIGKAAKPPA